MDALIVTILYALVEYVRKCLPIYKLYIIYLKVELNDQNQMNLESCVKTNSEVLGQCILNCGDDVLCEHQCINNFKKSHSSCPCQVCNKAFFRCRRKFW